MARNKASDDHWALLGLAIWILGPTGSLVGSFEDCSDCFTGSLLGYAVGRHERVSHLHPTPPPAWPRLLYKRD